MNAKEAQELARLLDKMRMKSTAELTRYAVRSGILSA